MMDDYDIVVAGGGPIGSFTAQYLASKGARVAILEEHETIGEPLHCAGLVTQRVFDIAGCSQTGLVQNKIYGAYIHSPDETILAIGGENVHALVINRSHFDQALAQAAQTAGANLLTGQKIVSAKKYDEHVALSIQHHEQNSTLHCRLVIGADGSHSLIRASFGFPKPVEILQGFGAEISDTTLDPKFVHIFVGQTIAPGFFAWVIPTNTRGTTARIGLCIRKQSTHPLPYYFARLLKHPLLHETTVIKKFGGTIPLGPLKRTVDDCVMLVGDAAAQVKPTSGGGIYPGLLCATHCALVADDAVQKQRFDDRTLGAYHMRWTKEIGRELSLGMSFRKIFTRLTDTQFNKYIKKLNNKKTIEAINSAGDIDYPSRLALPLLKTTPSLLSLAPVILKRKKV